MPAPAGPIPALGGQTFRVYEGPRQGSKRRQVMLVSQFMLALTDLLRALRESSANSAVQESSNAVCRTFLSGANLSSFFSYAAGRTFPVRGRIRGSPLSPFRKVGTTDPDFVFIGQCLETLLLPAFTTQTLAPSNAAPSGNCPVGKVPIKAPSLALNFVTLLLLKFVTQMLTPSNTTL